MPPSVKIEKVFVEKKGVSDDMADEVSSTLFVKERSVHRSFHYSAATNKRIAEYMLDYLEAEGLTSADAVREKIKEPTS